MAQPGQLRAGSGWPAAPATGTSAGTSCAVPERMTSKWLSSSRFCEVAHAEPVLLRDGHLLPEALAELEQRLPHEVVVGDDDARARVAAARRSARKRAPHVVERADHVGERRCSRRCGPRARARRASRRRRRRSRERVLAARLVDEPRRDVDADAVLGLERGQQVAGAAADLEHARARRHDEAHQPLDGAVVGARSWRASGRARRRSDRTRRRAAAARPPRARRSRSYAACRSPSPRRSPWSRMSVEIRVDHHLAPARGTSPWAPT